jgi:hypothetical protein
MSSGNAIFLVVAILLPLIPAYLLYRLLPSQADIEGPWQGLKIKVSGAFGGYFLLVITIFGYSSLMPSYDVWTVRGNMSFEDGPRMVDERTVHFTVRPPDISLHPDGDFRLTLFTVPDPSGRPQLPTLIIEHPNYLPVGVDLERYGSKNIWKRLVVLNDTLRLRPVPTVAEHEHQ